MKIRLSFVSNSSSTSFTLAKKLSRDVLSIVIDQRNLLIYELCNSQIATSLRVLRNEFGFKPKQIIHNLKKYRDVLLEKIDKSSVTFDEAGMAFIAILYCLDEYAQEKGKLQ